MSKFLLCRGTYGTRFEKRLRSRVAQDAQLFNVFGRKRAVFDASVLQTVIGLDQKLISATDKFNYKFVWRGCLLILSET